MYHRSKGLSFAAAVRDMNASSPRARVLAAETLGCAESEAERDQAFDALAKGIGDPRPEVRTTSCFALAALEMPAAWELISLCLSDEVPEVRQGAAISLGTLGAKEGFAPLAEALREGAPDLRFQAATSLVEIDAEAAYPLLLEALDDDDGEVLGAVSLALGAIGKPACADRIAVLLEHDAPQTRLDAAYALAQLGDSRGSGTLASFLEDSDLGWDAVMALESMGVAANEHLARFLEAPGGAQRVRVRAAGALLSGSDGSNASARACLVEALRSRKLELRGLAIQELDRCAGDWAKPALIALRNSFRGRRVREEIDAVLARIEAA